MPELPEVETSRRRCERLLKGKKIISVIPDSDDRIVFDQASPEELGKALEGARVLGTDRRGKYFWLELDRRPWPVFHLGMSGNVEVRSGRKSFAKAWGGLKLWRGPKRDRSSTDKFLPYCKLRIVADDGSEVAITDPRRFGRIRLAMNPLEEAPIAKLGFDPLINFPTAKVLYGFLRKRNAPIKSVLLDQGLFAGVGNWIADEVLFQSRLSPHRKAASLTSIEVTRLRVKLLSVIRTSVAAKADYSKYPPNWLFHHRWGKVKNSETSGKRAIVHDTIGGRTTAWVPKLQK